MGRVVGTIQKASVGAGSMAVTVAAATRSTVGQAMQPSPEETMVQLADVLVGWPLSHAAESAQTALVTMLTPLLCCRPVVGFHRFWTPRWVEKAWKEILSAGGAELAVPARDELTTQFIVPKGSVLQVITGRQAVLRPGYLPPSRPMATDARLGVQ